MNEKLLKRLSDHEDNFIERKSEGIKSNELRKTVVAFANSVPDDKTAVLFIGVGDNGEIVGVMNTDSLQKKIKEYLQDCYPQISCHLEVLEKNGKHIVAVEVFHSKERPHFSGPAYIRNGSQSIKASKEKFEELVATRNSKIYEIMKWKGKMVSVVACGKKLGSTKRLQYSTYRESATCLIEKCTPYVITLSQPATGTWFKEPLNNITLSEDIKNNDRLMLIVQESTP